MGVMHILHTRPLGEEQGCTEGCTFEALQRRAGTL